MICCLFVFIFLIWLTKSIIFPLCLVVFNYYIIAPNNRHIKTIQNSGEWAVVTGATDGIGREYSRQLAKLGMKMFLIGRDEEKLKNTVHELKQYHKIEARYYKADFCKTSIYEGLTEELKGLDIGILVNNVGMTQPYPCNFTELTLDHSFFTDIINCNVISAVSMTKIVTPQMVHRKRGIIVNVSSSSCLTTMPCGALYSSTKCFLTQFSRTVSYELHRSGVTVQTVLPFFVQTKFIGKFRPPRTLTPTADEYVASAIRMIGVESETFGTPSHAIQGLLLRSMPECIKKMVVVKLQSSRALAVHHD